MPFRPAAFLRPLFAALMLTMPAAAADAPATPAQREAVEAIVRDYLLRNPEVLVQALEGYRAKEAARKEQAASEAIVKQRDALLNHPMSPVSGNPKGDVTVVEFFDYQCGYCKRSLETMLDAMKSDPKLRVVWKDLPILGPVSRYAAEAAMASSKQGKYLDFHVAVMGARGQLTEARVQELAEKAGIDVARMKKDMTDPAIARYLDETTETAMALGITGTPGFIVGDHLIPGAIGPDDIRAVIAEARAAKK
ncbi:MAG: DsbA family protein [Alphaproteobacteria bacterium]